MSYEGCGTHGGNDFLIVEIIFQVQNNEGNSSARFQYLFFVSNIECLFEKFKMNSFGNTHSIIL